MGRRNRRDEQFTPLDLTPAELPKPKPRPIPPTREQVAETRRRREQQQWDAQQRQAAARVNHGIDWSVCIVPGCGEELTSYGRLNHDMRNRRDSTKELPICYRHAAIIWLDLVGFHTKRGEFIDAIADVNDALQARRDAEYEKMKADSLADTRNGDIYFIRLNGLVKVGWTRNIWQRLKSYGASAELLVNYPASRDDETNLHRQLRPALAKGREWYEDGPIIADFISKALKEYGSPIVEADWTTPKRIVAGKRHR